VRTVFKIIAYSIGLAFILSIGIIGCPRIGEFLVEKESESAQDHFDKQIQEAIDAGQVIMEIDENGKVTYKNADIVDPNETATAPGN
jgi:nucleoside-triphosphatase THEP1